MSQVKSLINGFTRKETIALTSCTSSRLAYLEKADLIVPQRIEAAGRPMVLFSWEQLLEIRAIKNLRKDISLQKVRKIVEFLNKEGYSDSLRDKKIVVINDEAYWVDLELENLPGLIMKVAGKNGEGLGQLGYYELIIVPSLRSMVDEVWESAQVSKIINFEAFKCRAKVSHSKAA
jgi:DNA-binding transcriptional MerR regulator